MRRRLAVIITASLLGGALLFASDSWNGFTLTAEVGQNEFGGSARLSYPALGCDDYAKVYVTVYFQDGSSKNASDSKYGPASAGVVYANTGGEPKIVDRVVATGDCKLGASTNTLNDTAYN